MNYLKIAAVSALMTFGNQAVIGQNYGDQAKQMGKEKVQEIKEKGKEKGEEKIAELKEKGLEKLENAKEQVQGKVAGVKGNATDKVDDLAGNAMDKKTIEAQATPVKEMNFDNTEGLTGTALSTARTEYAKEKADASVANIQGMNTKVSTGQAKINAAQQRLDAAKALTGDDALTPEAIAEKQSKIDAAKRQLSTFKSSVSSGIEKANAAKAGLSEINPVK